MSITTISTLPGAQPWSPTEPDDQWFMGKVTGVADMAIGDTNWPVVHLVTIDGDRLILLGVIREAVAI